MIFIIVCARDLNIRYRVFRQNRKVNIAKMIYDVSDLKSANK